MASEKSRRPPTGGALVIFLVLFLYSFSFSLLIPALPKLIQQYSPSFGVSTYYAGVYCESLSAIRYVAEFILCAYLGCLSDVWGRKGVLVLSLLINAAEFALIATYPSFEVLGITKFMRSSGAVISLANTVAYDVAKRSGAHPVKEFGMMMAATGLGFAVGPVAGAAMVPLPQVGGPQGVYVLASILSVLAALLTQLGYEEEPSTFKSSKTSVGPWDGIKLVWADPSLRDLTLAFELGNGTVGVFFTYLPYMLYRFNHTAMQAGIFLSASGMVNVIMLWALVTFVVPKVVDEKKMALYGMGFFALQYIISGVTHSLAVFYAANLVLSFTTMYGPAIQALMAKHHPGDQGAIQGALGALRMIIYFFSSQAFPHIYDFGLKHQVIGLPFYGGAVVCGLGVLPLLSYLRREESSGGKKKGK